MKLCISEYELSLVHRSLFAPDGSMHYCLSTYKLAQILENLTTDRYSEQRAPSSEPEIISAVPSSNSNIVAIVDGMALLHTISKPTLGKTCRDFGHFFSQFIDEKFMGYTEVHLVFDNYKAGSLKTAIRDPRQPTGEPTLEPTLEPSTRFRLQLT